MATTLVTGGSGTLGRHIVRRLVKADEDTRVLTRRSAPAWPDGASWFTGDLSDGHGVGQALDGCSTVIHCATDPWGGTRDITQAGNLLSEATRAGVEHVVFVSIVGCDRFPYTYHQTKAAVEGLVEDSGLGHTILRATQFHELLDWVLNRVSRLPVVPVPAKTYIQPVAAADVAERLMELVNGSPQGRAPDMGGPEVRTVRDLANRYLAAHHVRARATSLPLPGALGSALRSGMLLAPDNRKGHKTWEEHLSETVRERKAHQGSVLRG
ncbi:SDR family oxidoreductase [Halostreptopolyspora alba]|uniref:NAD-dependent epimerase/dehydratase family protein n=1 Tax=Halostreptopolyspora alba TaxID=2487137 RepID=A0A3N0E696_9ACTN|nr:NAD-dependent epimerase/dehydratase family protein [Nocardiopsaceae bacterium YIM 96095]